ncbi:hypothetical protein W5A_04494 [Imtechella halotolerans K1]|uniref:Peptidase M56 domain-containing protein n=1 Tax=Imtechella halotolerans K1 TaxID=946077 RepID=I0WIF9_9FLAO|nr:hypothetical protein [Imtechella halotolerans]EID76175.1 hypothetical protein W5A_04494 [Imtechella halotolerans K1]
MILVFRYIFSPRFSGLAFWPFIVVKNTELTKDSVVILHERIHLKQQAELLVLLFYIWYILEWLYRSACHKSFYLGYKNISFEREAYTHETNSLYLKNRRKYAFLQYMK